MVEAGVETPNEEVMQAQQDYTPTDVIELSHDMFHPSATYGGFNAAVQKDMVLSNLDKDDIWLINMQFDQVNDCKQLLAKGVKQNSLQWVGLQNLANSYLSKIALLVTSKRGKDGFTMKMMRSSFAEQKMTMRDLEGQERRKGGLVGKARQSVGI